MKILFLDIDGVLNSGTWFESNRRGMFDLDPGAVSLYNEIVEKTGCMVVISSSWRRLDGYIDELQRNSLRVDVIIGETPRLPRPNGTSVEFCERGFEIRSWIISNCQGVELTYAIVDDDSDMLPGQPFFQTSWKIGLTREITDNIIKHLNSNNSGITTRS